MMLRLLAGRDAVKTRRRGRLRYALSLALAKKSGAKRNLDYHPKRGYDANLLNV
jgi:hypothetical protein